MRKNENFISGITLITLVITIIVVFILVGVSVAMLFGDNGIINRASISKFKTERAGVIELAQLEIPKFQVDNGNSKLNRNQLKEILDTYFDNVPDDYTLDTTLKSKTEYGAYDIKVSEIYNNELLIENDPLWIYGKDGDKYKIVGINLAGFSIIEIKNMV